LYLHEGDITIIKAALVVFNKFLVVDWLLLLLLLAGWLSSFDVSIKFGVRVAELVGWVPFFLLF